MVSLFWSAVQSWGSKLTQFLVFLVLARLLSPAELGLAASSAVVLLLAAQLAEFGFGDAIVQRGEIEADDINGPFVFSIVLSLLITLSIYLSSGLIERALGVPGIGLVLAVSSGVAPLTTLSLFQEAINRRAFSFKRLAMRAFFSQLIGGLVAIAAAVAGAGVWSLIVQAYVGAIVSNVWMWRSPLWSPSLRFRFERFASLVRFGGSVVLTRLLDFVTSRTLDVIILVLYGPAALGLYTASSRIYLMLLQLLQQVVADVALAFLSRFSADRKLLGETFLTTSLLSSYFGSPVFLACAALAPELCSLLLGQRWAGSAALAQPLLVIGAVQCVQFVNGSYLSAVGRPHYTLLMNMLKAVVVVTVLILTRQAGIRASVLYFCIAQLVVTPISFGLVAREVKLNVRVIAANTLPSFATGLLCAGLITALRPYVISWLGHKFLIIQAGVLSLVFGIAYLVLTLLINRRHTLRAWAFLLDRVAGQRKVYG